MRKKSWVVAVGIIIVPSVFLALLDVFIGDTELFLLINQRITSPLLDGARYWSLGNRQLLVSFNNNNVGFWFCNSYINAV
jgi:hypothetical protein